ncbi:MAG TPA: formate dehydrogenase accessory sulfurtransferase FdhD [Methanocorpusculum sp.]|nr:formate dehydrogenase accessory sulfurtransferase FdhD [Methanocorpusculum sp.]
MMDEKPVQIIVNGRATLTLMTHAENKIELVLGALLTEKVIESMGDIESFLEEETQVSVVTKNPYSILLSRKTVLAGCGGASSFLDAGKLNKVETRFTLGADRIKAAAKEIAASCWFAGGIFDADGKLLAAAEDITSQNVFDRLIGFCLLQKISPAGCFIVLKGNAGVETMRKAIIAGVSCVGVFGEVTRAAADAADDAGLRLFLF